MNLCSLLGVKLGEDAGEDLSMSHGYRKTDEIPPAGGIASQFSGNARFRAKTSPTHLVLTPLCFVTGATSGSNDLVRFFIISLRVPYQ